MTERRIQNEIRNALADEGLFFRANVGRAWTGDVERLDGSTVLIRNARPFDTGLPAGFSDLFGARPVTITEHIVGRQLAVFSAIEVKAPRGRVSMKQERFIDAINAVGGFAGSARSVEDALQILRASI